MERPRERTSSREMPTPKGSHKICVANRSDPFRVEPTLHMVPGALPLVGGVDATGGLQKTSLGQKRHKTFFEGKNLVPRGAVSVCLDKADAVIDGYSY